MREFETSALPVLDSSGQLVGLFTEENVGAMLLMEGASRGKPRSLPPPGEL
jgi:predicted transcriptional regulator